MTNNNSYPHLLDLDFLTQLAKNTNRTVYIRITLDDSTTLPVYGISSAGGINIDGASSLRRSCNLTFVSENTDVLNYSWALNTEFIAEAGLANDINSKYEDIVYFPLGVFVITGFSGSLSVNSCTINLSGQDKMAKLNGTIGGTLMAEVDFGHINIETKLEDGTIEEETQDVPIKDIIYNVVHIFGGEKAENIEINYDQLKEIGGYNLLEYRGDKPLYLLLVEESGKVKVSNMTIRGETLGSLDAEGTQSIRLDSLAKYYQPKRVNQGGSAVAGIPFYLNGKPYQIRKIEYGDTAGYEKIELIYPGELIAKIGDTCVSVLDKIKNVLGGEFEYFYDVYGKFKFQRKPNYLKASWATDEGINITSKEDEAPIYGFEFSDMSMFTALSGSPDIKQFKNDFTIWGNRQSVSGNKIPIHLRVGIQNKPNLSDDYPYDWREWIYQKAKDYYQSEDKTSITETTGYEHYYMDLYSFWRELYDPEPKASYVSTWYGTEDTLYIHPWKQIEITTKNKKEYTYNDLYIQKNETGFLPFYAPAIESLDLSVEGAYNIKNLYIKLANQYIPVLDQSSFNKNIIYYIKEGEEYIPFYNYQNQAYIYNLYWKENSTGRIDNAFAQYVDIETLDLASLTDQYLEKYYIETTTSLKPEQIQYIGTLDQITGEWSDTIDNIQKAVLGDEIIYYQKVYSTQVQSLQPLDKVLVTKIFIPEDTSKYSLYYRNGNEYIPFIEFITGEDVAEDVRLNEITLYIQKIENDTTTYAKVIDTMYIDKYKLYLNKGTDEFPEYKSMAEDWYNNATGQTFYIQDIEEYDNGNLYNTNEENRAPQFETYYKIKWDGTIDDSIQYQKPIKYFVKAEEYYPEKSLYKSLCQDINGLSGKYTWEWGSLFLFLDFRPEFNGASSGEVTIISVSNGNSVLYDYDCSVENKYNIYNHGTQTLYTTMFKDTISNKWLLTLPYLNYTSPINEVKGEENKYYITTDRAFWNKNVYEAPDKLNFWFDLIEPSSTNVEIQTQKYSQEEIGVRPTAKNDPTVTAISLFETPTAEYGEIFSAEGNEFESLFIASGQVKSAYEELGYLLENHTYIQDKITINSIPIYHLQPNTRIKLNRTLEDGSSTIEEYTIDKLTIPMTYNGTMNINATKIIQVKS